MFILEKWVNGTSITSSLVFSSYFTECEISYPGGEIDDWDYCDHSWTTSLLAAAWLYLLQSECLSLCSISGLHIPIQEAVLPDSGEDGWANGWLGLPYSSQVWPWCHQYSLQSQWNCDGGLFLTWVQMLTEYGVSHSLVYFNWRLCLTQNLGPFQYAGFLYW